MTPPVEGKRIKAPHTFARLADARGWLAKMKEEFERDGGLAKKAEGTPPLREIFERKLVSLEKGDGSPNTIRGYRSTWNTGLKEHWADVPVGTVTEKKVIKWDNGMSWNSRTARPKAIQLLRNLLKFAYETGVIDTIPPTRLDVESLKNDKEPTIATPEQVAEIREAMPAELRITIDLAAWCAMRFGEIAALKGSDLNLSEGTIHITRSIKRGMHGEPVEGKVKSRASRRTIAIPPAALERIKQHIDWYRIGPDDLVVWQPDSDGKKWLNNKALHTRFDPAARAAGLAGMRFHDLRHTGLTLAGQAGATLAELMARAGHKDVETAMIYQHATLERDKALAQKLGG